MKPGDSGGMEPSTCFFLRRRQSRQHAKKRAATPRRPSGMPTPRPTFCAFVKGPLDAGGASATAVGMAVAELDVDEEAEWDFVTDDSEMNDREDALVYEVAKEVADAVGLLVRTLDAVDADTCVLLVASLLVCDALSLDSEDCVDLLGSAVTSVADAVAVAVAVNPPLVGASVGHAVCGPNFLIK